MEPLEKNLSISEAIVAQITENILSGGLPGGAELTQEELADTFGVSRMPVRDALASLEKRGLVERLPNRHIRVSRITADHMLQIFSTIALCQGQCLESLARDKAGWDAFVAQAPDEITSGTMLRFHRALVQAVACVYLRSLLADMTETFVRVGLHTPDAACCESFRRYRRALEARDLPECRRALLDHGLAMGRRVVAGLACHEE